MSQKTSIKQFACLWLALFCSPLLAFAQGYEVWLTDQNNTGGFSATAPRGTHGGRLLIYDSADLDNPAGPVNQPQVRDFSVWLAADGPNNQTGANVVRPHMPVPSPDGRKWMAISFVASGHVAIVNGVTKELKALFRMSPGAGGAIQAHAAFWTADGTALIVANQNGKLLERIEYNPQTDVFTHNKAATLNLATCTTPNGLPCQSATPVNESDPLFLGLHNRPDNAPICPVISKTDRGYITLRGGGLFVVDVRATPMAIVGEYGNALVGRDGCGGLQQGNNIYLSGGTGTTATNPAEFSLYHFKDQYPQAPNFLPPNAANFCLNNFRGAFPKVFFRDGTTDRDAHGMVLSANRRYLWQFDRLANVAEIFQLPNENFACPPPGVDGTPKRVNTVRLATPGISDDPTPDLGALSPRGDRIYMALRGPLPQTGAHASAGSTPGLGIIRVTQGGRDGALTHVLATSFLNPVNKGEESDPHAVTVRLK